MVEATFVGKDVEVWIGGQKYEGVESISYAEDGAPPGGRLIGGPDVYTASMEMEMAPETYWRFVHSAFPIRQATVETLIKRLGYGGRKGRRAVKRLAAMGFVVRWPQ